jgi:hypothetical protein
MGCWAAAEADMGKAGAGRKKEDLTDEVSAAVAMSHGVSPVVLATAAAAAAAVAWESLDKRGERDIEEAAECCLERYTALML